MSPKWSFQFNYLVYSGRNFITALMELNDFFTDFGVLNYQILPAGISYNQFTNGSLLISSLDKSSEGTYTCTAQNGIRSPIAKTVNVTVNGKATFLAMTAILSGLFMERIWRNQKDFFIYHVFQSSDLKFRGFGSQLFVTIIFLSPRQGCNTPLNMNQFCPKCFTL